MDTSVIANICCTVYYTVATIESIPAIVRIIRTKSSTDISLVYVLLSFIALTSWSAYIFLTEQTILVYIGTLWDILVSVVYYVVVLLYHKDSPI